MSPRAFVFSLQDCDLSTFGPDYCAAKDNPNALPLLWSLEHRKNNTYLVIALITLAFGIAVQTCIRLLEKRISEGKDEFSKEVMETAFRQIATISIVNVILWGTMQSNVAEVLDELLFGDVSPQHPSLTPGIQMVCSLLLHTYTSIRMSLYIRKRLSYLSYEGEADVRELRNVHFHIHV